MRKHFLLCARTLAVSVTALFSSVAGVAQETVDKVIERGLDRATSQVLLLAGNTKDKTGSLPKNFSGKRLHYCNPTSWVSGFFPGTLWYVYEYNREIASKKTQALLENAKNFTERLDSVKWVTDNHDVGFMINCSFGNGFRITGNSYYKEVMIQAARSLSTRFNPTVGCIKSWETRKGMWQYPVIIDNMLNLELLAEVSGLTGDRTFADMATSHAIVTGKNHFRPDGSCYHVVSYDTLSGKPHAKNTHQGYADPSAWARGQAWALYGYTMMYRETKCEDFLRRAERVAEYVASRLPEDGIPYWDFDDPRITGVGMPAVKADHYLRHNPVPRDASAGAIIASALIELGGYVDDEKCGRYVSIAEKILRTLTSDDYLAAEGELGGFILKHSVGNMAKNSEVDVALTYADYYYVEALMRMRRMRASQGMRDRRLWVDIMTRIARPVLESTAAGTLGKDMPYESVNLTEEARREVCRLEAFGRTIVGIAPWLELGEDTTAEGRMRGEYLELVRKAYAMSADPKNPDRMLFFHKDCKQPLVDAAYYALGLLYARTQIWDKLDKKDRKNIIAALLETRQIKPGEKNWTLFASVVEAALLEFTGKCDEQRMMHGIKKFQTEWYKGDGIYGDGMEFHYDYYNSIVIHPLLVASMRVAVKHGIIPQSELEIAEKRMGRYAQILERSISPEGSYPAVGRSICYRLAHFYALSQAGLDHILPKHLHPAQARTAMTIVIRRMMKPCNILDSNGWLRVGYSASQLRMGEKYINTGSVYMTMAGFVALGLPASDPFWSGPYMECTNKKAWDGIDVGVDHALRDLKQCGESAVYYMKWK